MGQASLYVLIRIKVEIVKVKHEVQKTKSERKKACSQTQGPLFGFCGKPSDLCSVSVARVMREPLSLYYSDKQEDSTFLQQTKDRPRELISYNYFIY